MLNQRKLSSSSIYKLALGKFGFVIDSNIDVLLDGKDMPATLRLFAEGGNMHKLAYSFVPKSGIILSYIISGNFELISYE